jgi:NAD(P)H-dependent flavin oxidoreductase YrpB (nitropropane dioxygenase family)
MHKPYFDSRYPLVMASMNGVSTLPLALACWQAGVFPSLVTPFRNTDFRTTMSPEDRRDAINHNLTEFKKVTGHCDVIVGLMYGELEDAETMQLIVDHHVSHVELFSSAGLTLQHNPMRDKYQKLYEPWFTKKLKTYGSIRFMERCRQLTDSNPGTAIGVRGTHAGGGTNAELTTREMFDQQRQLTPDAVIIPYGGIGTPEQVAYYVNAGATAVGIGTLFAACAESSLSLETKNAMIVASADNIIRLPDTRQNILPLGALTDIVDSQSQSVANRDSSLYAGIRGDGTVGHIYAGHGIKHVTTVRTVQQTVEYLTSHLI